MPLKATLQLRVSVYTLRPMLRSQQRVQGGRPASRALLSLSLLQGFGCDAGGLCVCVHRWSGMSRGRAVAWFGVRPVQTSNTLLERGYEI